MENSDIEWLAAKLRKFGFEEDWKTSLAPYLHTEKHSLVLKRYEFRKGDRITYNLHLRKDVSSGFWIFPSYHATLRIAVRAEHELISGIDTRKLERRLNDVDWNLDYGFIAEKGLFLGRGIERIMADIAENVLAELQQLHRCGPQGKTVAEALMVKFFANTPNEKLYGVRELKKAYERSNIFYVDEDYGLTTKEAHGILCGRAVYREFLDAEGSRQAGWLKMGPRVLQARKAAKGIFFSGQELYSSFDLEPGLRSLSLQYSGEFSYKGLLKALREGDNPYITRNGRDFFIITVNPERQDFDFYSSPELPASRADLMKTLLPLNKPSKGRSNSNKPKHTKP